VITITAYLCQCIRLVSSPDLLSGKACHIQIEAKLGCIQLAESSFRFTVKQISVSDSVKPAI